MLNLAADEEAAACVAVGADDDTVAVLGKTRKLLLFKIDELPVMTRGRGLVLQRYAKGGLADAKTFKFDEGRTRRSGERLRTEIASDPWRGRRAQAGRLPPKGFTRANRFT